MWPRSRCLFYRERIILNFFIAKLLAYFNIWKSSHVHVTKLGKIKGTIDYAEKGSKYYSFQGIPYGKPMLGENRFKISEPAGPWTGTLDATKVGKKSIQTNIMTRKINGDEDCLNLNVYTSELPSSSNELKPVMVFIHGGAFLNGSNDKLMYGPDNLMNDDVVLVVINYRLGLLGFLSLKDPSLGVTGNMGFKDMVLALKWVQENIKDYNGDPNNVTIFGESAGSASVHLLMLSPLAKGLFHKVIAQSGSALNGWSRCEKNVAEQAAPATGCESKNEKEILDHFRTIPVEKLWDGQRVLEKRDKFSSMDRFCGWSIEPPSDTAFLTKSPIDIITSGEYSPVPLMMGFTNCEGMLYEGVVSEKNKPKYWEKPEVNVPSLLELERESAVRKNLGEKIVKFYLGEGPYSRANSTLSLYDLLTDNCFSWGIFQAVRHHAKLLPNSVYLYRFSLDTKLNFYKHLTKIITPGTSHADDLPYLFNMCLSLGVSKHSIEDIARKRVCRLWTNFAKFGNPTPANDNLVDNLWMPVTKDTINFYEISEDPHNDVNPWSERMNFWNEIYSMNEKTAKLTI